MTTTNNLYRCPVCGRMHPIELTFNMKDDLHVCMICASDLRERYDTKKLASHDDSEVDYVTEFGGVEMTVGDIRNIRRQFLRALSADQYMINECEDFANLVINMAQRRMLDKESSWETIHKEVFMEGAKMKIEMRTKEIADIGWEYDEETFLRLVLMKNFPDEVVIPAAKQFIEDFA